MSIKQGYFEETKPEIEVTAYVYPYKFFCIGWVVVRDSEPPVYYYDNEPLKIETTGPIVRYITFGLTTKSVFNRVKRWVIKNIGQ